MQEADINREKQSLLNHIRTTLHNGLINLVTKIEEHTDNQQYYSPKDKFKKMAEKNPSLIELQRRLGLDIDF